MKIPFIGRVVRVHEAKGFSFLEGVRAAQLPDPMGDEPASAVLERWERICPGFVEWGAALR